MITVLMTGPRGSGKTTAAEAMAKSIGSVYRCTRQAGRFSMSDYEGEDVLIFDEAGSPPPNLFRDERMVIDRKGQEPDTYPMPKMMILIGNK